MIINKCLTLIWFIKKPKFWRNAMELFIRKFRTNYDTNEHLKLSIFWARSKVISLEEVLIQFKLIKNKNEIPIIDSNLLEFAYKKVSQNNAKIGGPAYIDLLYSIAYLSNAKNIIETGVAYGWSSLALLAAISRYEGSALISIDMPYPKMNTESKVGIVVPEMLKDHWKLIKEPDRNGIFKAIKINREKFDICHYDSDKSWWGRAFAYPLLWSALKPGGYFISDDIQDNLFFVKFCEKKEFAVTEFQGKFVGIIKKNI